MVKQLIKSFLDQITAPKAQSFSKHYHATELIQCWHEHSIAVSDYDTLIISYLMTIPEDVSVKTTLQHALTACFTYRKFNIEDSVKSSQACAFALALRRQLFYWDPEMDGNQN